MLVHIRPRHHLVCPQPRLPSWQRLRPVLCPTTVLTVSPPSAQSPFAQCGCDLPLRRRSFRLLGGHYSSFFAPTDSFVSRSGLSSTSVLPRSRSLCKLSTSPCCPPDLPDDYVDFVSAVVARYGSAGIPVIEIWNEPNLSREWGGATIDRTPA